MGFFSLFFFFFFEWFGGETEPNGFKPTASCQPLCSHRFTTIYSPGVEGNQPLPLLPSEPWLEEVTTPQDNPSSANATAFSITSRQSREDEPLWATCSINLL